MSAYYVTYKMYSCDKEKGILSPAQNKIDAYNKAVYELIPKKEGTLPYSAWVSSVTYNSGKYRTFNNHEGKPY